MVLGELAGGFVEVGVVEVGDPPIPRHHLIVAVVDEIQMRCVEDVIKAKR